MNLTIETFQRPDTPDSYIAIACPEGALLSAGSVGGGTSERSAIQEAINAFFTRKGEAERARSASTLTLPRVEFGGASGPISGFTTEFTATAPARTPDILGPRRVTEQAAILTLLEDALLTVPHAAESSAVVFVMDYADAEGNATTRKIRPTRIEDKPGRFGFSEKRHLIAYDVDKSEPRTFRLDRIEALEVCDA